MDKASRRQQLLKAARDVFANKGYHDAKVDDICAIAGVAKGTFYLYFPDKRSVFSELVDGLLLRLTNATITVAIDRDVEAQVKDNIRGVVAVLLEDPKLTQILMSYATGLDPAFVQKIESFYAGTKRFLQESLEVGQQLGIVAPGDTHLYAICTVGALKELLFENTSERSERSIEQIVDAIFAFLQHGYLRLDQPKAKPARVSTKRAKRS
jgi:AcrR family transcriptional regulator